MEPRNLSGLPDLPEPDWQAIERERGLTIHSRSFLGEGWNARAFLVNGELVFRFPKHLDQWEELEREIAFLSFAADRLPLPVPRYVHVDRDSSAAPWGYAAYRFLPGTSMDPRTLRGENLAAAANDIAEFLRALHTLQPPPPVDALLPREDARIVAETYCADAERVIVPRLSPAETCALRALIDEYLATQSNFQFRPVVLHADLSKDHLLVDNDTLAGVIDFGDISWGDADYDFMYLSIDCGETFAIDVARRYGHADLERLMTKLHYFDLVDQIGTILHGGTRALAGQEDAAWRRLTQLLGGAFR